MRQIILLTIFCLLAAANSLAQAEPVPNTTDHVVMNAAAINQGTGPFRGSEINEPNASYYPSRSFIRNMAVEGALAPLKSQKQQYKDFLKQKNTGLMRIIAEEKCWQMSRALRLFRFCPAASNFRFKEEQHFDALADIRLNAAGNFETGVGKDAFGEITAMGDIALDQITPETPEAKRLANITVPKDKDKLAAANADANRIEPMKLNRTYLLRSTVKGWSDVLVAFRVVEIEPNGAVVVIWKELKKK